MDDVAAAVGLNKGTLYYYYQGKASIPFDIVYRLEEGRLAIAREKPFHKSEGPVAVALREFIEDTANYILDNPVSSRIATQESPFLDMWLDEEQLTQLRSCHDEYHAFLVELIEAGITSGELGGGNPSVMAQGITGALSWMPRWFRSKGPLSKVEVAAQLTEMLINGIVSGEKPRISAPARAPKVEGRGAGTASARSEAKKRSQPRRREKASTRRARAAEINKELI
jgi:AcrR family transcriptional regulator